MRARLVRIGNSRGVRLPKGLIEEAGLTDNVDLAVQAGGVLITPVRATRADWAAAARLLVERGEGGLLDATGPTRFDRDEWAW